jgi:hypothetical protein
MESIPSAERLPVADAQVVEPVSPAKVRRAFWVVLLVLGGLQAWAARHTTTPDGMSYVDLSDAVAHGSLGELLNTYWSPLYPALLGALRLILGRGPYWEFAIQHFLNVLLFAASIGGFEYFLGGLRRASAEWGRTELTTTRGTAAAYGVFGVLSLMMTPLSLPTPDLAVSTAVFIAFGALLRLQHEADWRRPAIVLGLALALGSLTKSFIIPWSVLVLLAAGLVTRSRWGWRPGAAATAVWLALALPWCVALSLSVGRPTFGDTGRLTYVWYVNGLESPSDQIMPRATATPRTDSILTGVAILPGARGTNPIWYDPARWYSGLTPRFGARKQLDVFAYFVSSYVASLAPVVLFLWFCFAVVRRDDRRLWWLRTWTVMAPSLAAMAAYSLIITTTRYIAPFTIAMVIVTWMGTTWPSRIPPGRMLLAIGVPFLIMAAPQGTSDVLAWESAALGSVLVAWSARRWGTRGMVIGGVLGAAAIILLLPAELRSIVTTGALLIVACYWIASRRAIANHEGRRFSMVVRRGVIVTGALLIGYVALQKYRIGLEGAPAARGEPNRYWAAADDLRKAGVAAGDAIAIVGSPFSAYWARTARLRIVAIVPPRRLEAYRALSPESRQTLLREFARAGARHVIVQTVDSPAPGDASWTPISAVGWTRRLTP